MYPHRPPASAPHLKASNRSHVVRSSSSHCTLVHTDVLRAVRATDGAFRIVPRAALIALGSVEPLSTGVAGTLVPALCNDVGWLSIQAEAAGVLVSLLELVVVALLLLLTVPLGGLRDNGTVRLLVIDWLLFDLSMKTIQKQK